MVKEDVVAAVKEFFIIAKLLKEVNTTAIVLMPKVVAPATVKDYRPVACCNTVYKIIAKILAERLQLVLEGVVDNAQCAFIQNRSMAHNILLSQELMLHYTRQYVSPRCAIKLDIHKAYDSLQWEFLEGMLTGLNFPHKFVSWVKACFSSPAYSVVVNGALHGFFSGQRGLRQGNPFSLLLFVIDMDYLSRLLKCRVVEKNFQFHPKCLRLNITHLCFADDVMIFTNGTETAVEVVKQVIDEFSAISG